MRAVLLQHREKGCAHLGLIEKIVARRFHRNRTGGRTALVLQGGITGEKDLVARNRNTAEEPIAIVGQRHIADLAAPAGGCALGRRRLPDRLLIVMRKQFRRQRILHPIRAVVLLTRQWHHQWPDIELHRRLARVEQAGEPGHVGVQRIFAVIGQGHRRPQFGGGQRCLRQHHAGVARAGARRANRVVFRVARIIESDDGVRIVVATDQKDTHQRLVVGSRKRGGLPHCSKVEQPGGSQSGERRRAGVAQETAAR